MFLPTLRYGRLGIWCFLLILLVGCTDVTPMPTATSLPDAPPVAANPTLPPLPSLTPTTAGLAVPPVTETALPYPIATETAVAPYPIASSTPLQATATLLPATPLTDYETFLPLLPLPAPTVQPTPTLPPTPTATFTPVPTPTPIPVLDFAALREQLRADGQDLSTVKIGFHTSVGGNTEGLDRWMQMLDAAGVPFFLKSVDNAQPLFLAQEMMKQSGVPHVLVFRRASGSIYNVPEYDLTPELAAQRHWDRHMEIWPPELDPSLIWLETINEVDRTKAEWLGQFALATAELSLAAGYNWAAFGWASGEPEPEHWQEPSMLAFLRLAGQNPDRLAIALHEYSYVLDDIGHEYPYKLGRFQELFRICDEYGIPRPTVLITEWGWTYNNVPDPADAIRDIAWASRLYAPYPEVKGAAIWFLGIGYDRIADQTQKLIEPLLVYSLTNYHTAPLPPSRAPIAPEAYRPNR